MKYDLLYGWSLSFVNGYMHSCIVLVYYQLHTYVHDNINGAAVFEASSKSPTCVCTALE